MRRQARAGGRSALVVAALAALVLAGCTQPPEGVDGDLTGDWGGMAEPVSFTPEAQVCHAEAHRAMESVDRYNPVDCQRPHLQETAHVGLFTDEASEGEEPPGEDSWQRRAAFSQCEEQLEDFLGADFRYGRLWLGVAVPTPEAWEGGARWFRCDLSELDSVAGAPIERTGSLSGALAEEDSPLRLGCYEVQVDDDDLVERRTPVSCDEAHQAEFVGLWRPGDDDDYPDADGGGDSVAQVYDGCRSEIADFADLPDDGDVRFRVGAIADWMSEQDWNAGDRAFRCYLWTQEDVSESLAGAGTDALPKRTE